tara:strand:- start:31 stop:159 length:129 start_codon:yes stop_codon:yes gene_type:complete
MVLIPYFRDFPIFQQFDQVGFKGPFGDWKEGRINVVIDSLYQ